MITVRTDDPRSSAVAQLIAYHHANAHKNSPPGFSFVLGPEALAVPGVTFFTAWDGDSLAGMGAIKDLGDGAAEIKSMRTAPDHLRKGVAAAILAEIVATARTAGFRRLNLETGSTEEFAAALALYRGAGFVDCAAFADYPADSAFNCYMTREL